MRFVERARAHPWLLAVATGVLVGAVIGLFLPIRAAQPPKADEATWALPSRTTLARFDEARYQSVRSARYWGEIRTPGARGPQAVAWTLGGIVTRPTLRIAVSIPGKPGVAWVGLGGILPDGAAFVAANRDTVWFEKDGCRRARKLYQKPTAESEACIGAKGVVAPVGRPAPAPVAPSVAAPPARNPH